MGSFRSNAALGAALLLGLASGIPSRAAEGPAPTPTPASSASKSAHGTLEKVDVSLSGLFMRSDQGKRLAWRFEREVIAHLTDFKPGAPVVVIYRERGSDKAVTAIGFPGAADTPTYVNTTGERVELVSGPMVDGACGAQADEPPHTTSLPRDGRAETADACWCCAPAGQTCTPSNKTGLGRAFLTRCYQ
jgi:hypothetical protein